MDITPHQQQAEALFEEWVQRFAHLNDGPVFTKEDAINFAAFCLEKSGWKKYPDEKPKVARVLLAYDNGIEVELGDNRLLKELLENGWEHIYWMEIPPQK